MSGETVDDGKARIAALKGEMSTWDKERRRTKIQRIFVAHANNLTATLALEDAYDNAIRMRESSPAFLVGDSRCGKSELIKRFMSAKTSQPVPDVPFGCSKILGSPARAVYLNCQNGATPRQACNTMLEELFKHWLSARGPSQQEASLLLMKHFQREKIDMLVIDEAQKMYDGQSPKDLVNWIVSMRDAGFFRIFVTGDRSLLELIDTHKVLRDSKHSLVELRPLGYQTEKQKGQFAAFLKKFDEEMPFVSTPLADEGLEEAFFFATRGRPGVLANLLEGATVEAFRRLTDDDGNLKEMPRTMTVGDLARAFKIKMATETRMLKINPFTHSGPFPSYPKTLEGELDELQRALAAKAARGRQRASRLYDDPK
ncbi:MULTISPECIES: ATP-binding protein [unclassified Devosia]|uniref:ATP-binding protein n=1 Tax=unclassified Devosia TaxID=196773 RepID=UPI0015FAEF79|nr:MULTISPECIES: ATP-binding protein [unclassified Devosia]MBJ6986264.1 ATP-binding protein [Devosia sp. MC521]MBJ7576376.1 ATP-binding protein [Devosia sp. MC532]QMW64253.1 ATP-binding protein [Devosia sp. MC521]